jgi:hypothetical protein
MGFTKNNEYFNPMFDGYTLFGIQVHPNITYTLSDNFRIDGGVYLRQDFGNDGFQEVIPTFTFRAIYNNIDILFGSLDGSLNHGMIEPLYDFEKVMMDRIEQGNQFRYKGKKLDLDLWIDWLKMIYPRDPDQEEVYGGIRSNYLIKRSNTLEIYYPVQLILYHRGGSIDFNPNPIKTVINVATGIELTTGEDRPGKWEFSGYYLYYRDFNFNSTWVYEDGNAFYFNVMRHFKHGLKIMTSYWSGNEFLSILGGKIYPSASSKVKNPYSLDPNRNLLILRVMHDIDLGNGVVLTTRVEPLFDFTFSKFDFSHGLYLNFRKTFQLGGK